MRLVRAVNTPLIIKNDNIYKAYEASIICYIVMITPLVIGLEMNNTSPTTF